MLLRSSRTAISYRPHAFAVNRASRQARGLIGYWPLMGQFPRQEYFGRNKYPLDINGDCVVRSSPEFGPAPDLDGSGDYFSMSTASSDFHNNSVDFATSIWVRGAMTSGADVGIFGRWQGAQGWMTWFLNNDLRIGDSASSAVIYSGGQAIVQDNRWHHIVARYPGGAAANLCVDGRQVATGSGGGLGGDPNTPLLIGQYANGGGSLPYTGQVADARFYLRLLTDADVWEMYDPRTRWDLFWVPSTRTHFFLNIPAGGTTYTQSVAGTATTAGALIKQTRRALTGAAATAGALLKQTNRSLTGTLATASALTAIKIALKSLAGTLTTAGSLVKQPQKVLTATLTTAAILTKETRRALTASLASSATLTAIKTALKSLAGTLTLAGALVKQTQIVRAGTLASSGTVSRLTSRALVGTLAIVGGLIKLTRRALTGILTMAGAVSGSSGIAHLSDASVTSVDANAVRSVDDGPVRSTGDV